VCLLMPLILKILSLKFDLTVTLISILVLECSFTIGNTLNGTVTFSVVRYFISSNSPSGGIKLIVLSLSNFPNLTH